MMEFRWRESRRNPSLGASVATIHKRGLTKMPLITFKHKYVMRPAVAYESVWEPAQCKYRPAHEEEYSVFPDFEKKFKRMTPDEVVPTGSRYSGIDYRTIVFLDPLTEEKFLTIKKEVEEKKAAMDAIWKEILALKETAGRIVIRDMKKTTPFQKDNWDFYSSKANLSHGEKPVADEKKEMKP
jgi:hypothetical protein